MNVGTNLNSSKDFTKEYYKILSSDYPSFLEDYTNTPEMQRIATSCISCGCNYTNIFDLKFMYTNLDHSIAVALIIWNFTKDKKATLAGLFHDISTPAFKHCIDFMNGDYENQESTEERTESIIVNSTELMALLKRDNIKLGEVIDYKLYPIADNDTPKLSADRLEYTLANGIFWKPIWNMEELKGIYKDLIVSKNEGGIDELTFKTPAIAEFFVEKASVLWQSWIANDDKITMQFIADTCKRMNEEGFLTIEDLYSLSEKEIINKIIECPNKSISNNFLKFVGSTVVYDSEKFVEDKYCKSIKAKRRYINPLVLVENKIQRISTLSSKANNSIQDFLKWNTAKYGYLDFELEK